MVIKKTKEVSVRQLGSVKRALILISKARRQKRGFADEMFRAIYAPTHCLGGTFFSFVHPPYKKSNRRRTTKTNITNIFCCYVLVVLFSGEFHARLFDPLL